MLTQLLEPTDDRANPVFKDAASCKRWLEKLQTTNMQLAHSLLLTEINELNRFAMRGQERLDTLEMLRDAVHYVQHEYGKRLVAKPLPLNENELIAFFAIVQLWLALATGYQRCLQTAIAGDKYLDKRRTLLCQRAMRYGELAIGEYARTGYEVDGRLWRLMHDLYQFAEAQQLLSGQSSDPLNQDRPSRSCIETYLETLLTDLARPAALTRAQLHLLAGWMPQWTAMLTIEHRYAASRGDAPPLAFDLEGPPHGLQLAMAVPPGVGVRYLAMISVSKSIRVRSVLLQQGKSPEQVDLGTVAGSRECLELLVYLHRRWCEEPGASTGAGAQRDRLIQLCHQTENIYAHLTGKPSAESSMELWSIDRENPLETELTRASASGGQLGRRQLVALRRGDDKPYTLAATAWVQVARTGQLRAGVHFLPGEVEAINLQATEADQAILPRAAGAFLLHAIPGSKLPPSLIVPRIWFKAGRVVEILKRSGEKQAVRLAFSVEQGVDFERVSFMPA